MGGESGLDELLKLAAMRPIGVGCVGCTGLWLGNRTVKYINRGNEHKMVAANGGEEFAEESEELGIFGRRLIDPPLFGRHRAVVVGVV